MMNSQKAASFNKFGCILENMQEYCPGKKANIIKTLRNKPDINDTESDEADSDLQPEDT